MSVKVSVVIPTYNCAAYISDALDSVLNQSFKDFEIIIVDDGSIDNTKNIIHQYMAKHNCIKYIYQENKGPVYARNSGILNSLGEFIAFLDADDIWLPEKLKLQIRIFQQYPDVYLVHADVCNYDGHNIYPRDRINLKPSIKAKHSGMIFYPLYTREVHIATSTVIVRRECFDKVGMFDENMKKMCTEDRDMWTRIARKYRFYYIDEALAYFRLREKSRSRYVRNMLEGQIYVINKIANQYNIPLNFKLKAMSNSYYESCQNSIRINNYFNSIYYLSLSLCHYPFGLSILRKIFRAGLLLGKAQSSKYLTKSKL